MAATFASPAAGPRPPVRAAQRAAGRGPLGLDGLRLTRRGRAVVVALALLVSMPLVGAGGRAVAEGPGAPLEVTVHTVAPGETLWEFATQIAQPGQDVRDVVEHLRELNELTSGALWVGQTILLPRG